MLSRHACVVKDTDGSSPLDNNANAGYIGASNGRQTVRNLRIANCFGSNEVEVRWREVK